MSNVMSSEAGRPDVEVSPIAKRRQFSTEYKRRILREAAQAKERGEVGALLRREGLYSSHLAKWREQAESGLSPKKRGPKPRELNPLAKRVAELERANRKLAARAERAEALVALQKKKSP